MYFVRVHISGAAARTGGCLRMSLAALPLLFWGGDMFLAAPPLLFWGGRHVFSGTAAVAWGGFLYFHLRIQGSKSGLAMFVSEEQHARIVSKVYSTKKHMFVSFFWRQLNLGPNSNMKTPGGQRCVV